jgi:hypothetical protein
MIGCQAAVAVTFARAAATKFAGRAAFDEFCRWLVVGVRIPPPAARPIAVTVVAAEAATAIAVVIPVAVSTGFRAATLLLAVFTTAVAAMWRRQVAVPCRCFGAGRHPPGMTHLIRNMTLLLVAAGGLLLSWAGITSAPLDPVGALAAIAGAAVALLLIELEDIVEVVRPLRLSTRSSGVRTDTDQRKANT